MHRQLPGSRPTQPDSSRGGTAAEQYSRGTNPRAETGCAQRSKGLAFLQDGVPAALCPTCIMQEAHKVSHKATNESVWFLMLCRSVSVHTSGVIEARGFHFHAPRAPAAASRLGGSECLIFR